MVLKPVPRGGRFLGSLASLFKKRAAADIHFEYYWDKLGNLLRICSYTPAWGHTLVFVQKARRQAPGAQPTPYQYSANGVTLLDVEDQGQQFLERDDVPLVPDDYDTEYEINEQLVVGLAVPWHNFVILRKNHKDRSPLHYHQAKRRGAGKNSPPPIRPRNKGSHWSFMSLQFSVQVQSSRRAMPT